MHMKQMRMDSHIRPMVIVDYAIRNILERCYQILVGQCTGKKVNKIQQISAMTPDKILHSRHMQFRILI